MIRRISWVLVAAGCSSTPQAANDAEATPDEGAADSATEPPVVPAVVARYCGTRDWTAGRVPATLGGLDGKYKGYEGSHGDKPLRAGIQEVTKLYPEQPFLAKKVRVAFAKGSGTARLHLTGSFGRSYPNTYPSTKPESLPDFNGPADLAPPVEVTVENAKPDEWHELDLEPTILEPNQVYMLAYEHLSVEPYLAEESIPSGKVDRSLFFYPGERDSWLVGGFYRLELVGETFCSKAPAERDFVRVSPSPFGDTSSLSGAFADLDGDGKDDAIFGQGSPVVYFGDGKGGFGAPKTGTFPGLGGVRGLVFGDLDNDGDQDAFAIAMVTPDSDGDGYTVNGDGPLKGVDCDDHDPAVNPGTTEKLGNGKDDDCDGKADDGLSTRDADGDGYTIAGGDCDDTKADTHPGAPELFDGRDNDCNGNTDETFVSKVFVNDGKGKFTPVANPEVDVVAPSSAIALGDADLDGVLDAYVGRQLVHYPDFDAVPSKLFGGLGDGHFVDSTLKAGTTLETPRPVYGVFFTDFNNDGLPDIYVSNYQLSNNLLWKNTGAGKFINVARDLGVDHDDIPNTTPGSKLYPGGHSYGADSADIDGDGDLDIFVPNIAHPRFQPWSDQSMLLINQGPPSYKFVNERRTRGIPYDEGDIDAQFVDFDNDGNVDLSICSTYPMHFTKLYRNDGTGHFTDVTWDTGTAMHQGQSMVWSDVDGDGDLDLLQVGGTHEGPPNALYLNQTGNKRAWVFFELVGKKANRDAVGARVTLQASGKTQLREVKAGGGTSGHQSSKQVHFGLGEATSIESVTVRWPGGATETFTGVTPKGRFRLVEGAGAATLR